MNEEMIRSFLEQLLARGYDEPVLADGGVYTLPTDPATFACVVGGTNAPWHVRVWGDVAVFGAGLERVADEVNASCIMVRCHTTDTGLRVSYELPAAALGFEALGDALRAVAGGLRVCHEAIEDDRQPALPMLAGYL